MKTMKPYIIALITILMLQITLQTGQAEAASKMPDGSKVSDVTVAGKTDAEVKALLDGDIATWLSGENIELVSEFESFSVPRTVIAFDSQASIDELNNLTKRTWKTFFLRPKNKTVTLQTSINRGSEAYEALAKIDYINVDATLAKLVTLATTLDDAEIEIVYQDTTDTPVEVMATATRAFPESVELSGETMKHILEALNNFTIEGEGSLQLIDALALPEGLEDASTELSFVGSVLYEAFLKTNLEFVERYQHVELPTYATLGTDVFVDVKREKDLIVLNPNEQSYKISIGITDNALQIELLSSARNVTYEVTTENEQEIKPKEIYRFDETVKSGTKKLVQKGKAGNSIEIYRSTYQEDELVKKEIISTDIYIPVPEINAVSPDDVERIAG